MNYVSSHISSLNLKGAAVEKYKVFIFLFLFWQLSKACDELTRKGDTVKDPIEIGGQDRTRHSLALITLLPTQSPLCCFSNKTTRDGKDGACLYHFPHSSFFLFVPVSTPTPHFLLLSSIFMISMLLNHLVLFKILLKTLTLDS